MGKGPGFFSDIGKKAKGISILPMSVTVMDWNIFFFQKWLYLGQFISLSIYRFVDKGLFTRAEVLS
jgi:hypothetical protein